MMTEAGLVRTRQFTEEELLTLAKELAASVVEVSIEQRGKLLRLTGERLRDLYTQGFTSQIFLNAGRAYGEPPT